MKCDDPGHSYQLDMLDAPELMPKQLLWFVKREGPGYPGNVGRYPGTNIQEVLRALIDRVKYLDGQIPCFENKTILKLLRLCLFLLERRAAARHGRELKVADDELIELLATCPKCGHIHCTEEEHRR